MRWNISIFLYIAEYFEVYRINQLSPNIMYNGHIWHTYHISSIFYVRMPLLSSGYHASMVQILFRISPNPSFTIFNCHPFDIYIHFFIFKLCFKIPITSFQIRSQQLYVVNRSIMNVVMHGWQLRWRWCWNAN